MIKFAKGIVCVSFTLHETWPTVLLNPVAFITYRKRFKIDPEGVPMATHELGCKKCL